MPDDQLESDKKITKADEEFEAPTIGGEAEKRPKNQPENPEFELTPEIEEQIMAKVQDIDEKGIAYSSISEEEFSGILRYGILSRNWGELDEGESQEVTPDNWAKNVRRKKAMHVFANIVGKNAESVWGEDPFGHKLPQPELGGSHYLKSGLSGLAILFGTDRYKKEKSGVRGEKQKVRTYRSDNDDLYTGVGLPETEYGYHFAYRVPPRFFKGIVFRKMRELTKEEKYLITRKAQEERPDDSAFVNGRWRNYSQLSIDELMYATGGPHSGPIEEDNRETVIEYVSKLAKSELSIMKKPELFIPIYDLHGNLWWPRQMSYEEVRKFVAERNAKKEEVSEQTLISESASASTSTSEPEIQPDELP